MFFKEQIKKRIKNEKGLTLIELLAVIVILAIIAAIAIPAIGNIISNSRAKSVVSDAQNVLSAANLYFTDENTAENGKADATDLAEYVDNKGTLTSFVVTKKSTGNTIKFTTKEVNGIYYTGEDEVTLTDLTGAKYKKGIVYKSDGTTKFKNGTSDPTALTK